MPDPADERREAKPRRWVVACHAMGDGCVVYKGPFLDYCDAVDAAGAHGEVLEALPAPEASDA